MQGPDFLSDDLQPYLALPTDEELFKALTRQPSDLILFFEAGCEDEVWFRQHVHFIRSVLRWGARQFYLNRLPIHYAKQLAAVIQAHYGLLHPFLFFQPALFFTMKLVVEEHAHVVNSLLFGTSSPFFKDLFSNCFNELTDYWTLSHISLPVFQWIEQYALRGKVEELWRCEYKELLAVMRQAKAWSFPGLIDECALRLKKYISRDNVIETLLQAHRQFFLEWKRHCCEVFNQQGYGLRLPNPETETELKVEVLDFKQETLELFERLAPFTTHLAFSGDLSLSSYYGKLIDACPRLVGMDLSGSSAYDNQFDDLPGSLVELNLSVCPWLKPSHLKEVGYQFLSLKKLHLDGNVQLDYQAWGELNRLRYLAALSLAACSQLGDEDLKLISRNCSHLFELNIEECRNITDRGISDLIMTCPHLMKFNCSRCSALTDKSLAELGVHGHQLSQLSLVRCTELTDSGLFQLVRSRPNLAYLNIKGCEFSLRIIEKIRQEYPFLQIVD